MSVPKVATKHQGWSNVDYNVPHFDPNPPHLPPKAVEVFETYSKIAPNQILDHIAHVRELAWHSSPFPCVGLWLFVQFEIANHPQYHEVVSRLVSDRKSLLLDMGSGIGQDLRALVADGVLQDQLLAMDINQDLWDIGKKLAKDEVTWKVELMQLNVFDDMEKYRHLDGKLEVVHAADLFHLFPWEQQITLAVQTLKLLRPHGMIFGRNVGTTEQVEFQAFAKGGKSFRHDASSIQKMWQQAAEAAHLHVRTFAEIVEYPITSEAMQRWQDGKLEPFCRVIFAVHVI